MGSDDAAPAYGLPADLVGVAAAMDRIAAARQQGPGSGQRGNAETLRRYWSEGEGAAQIRWGQEGDWGRCQRLLEEHGHMTPDQAAGYCNLLHKRALGFYPATHKQMMKGPATAGGSTSFGSVTAAGGGTSGGEAGSTTPGGVTAPAMGLPALVTIPGVDLVAAGTWTLSSGRQTFTRADLQSAIDAAACPAVGAPVIKIGHLDKRFAPGPADDGEPAIGRVSNLRLSENGAKLVGDLAGMPGWLGAVAASAFPRRSVEGKYRFRCQIGHQHGFVLTALALLGVTPPGVGVLGGLADIAQLYGLTASAPAGQAWRTEPTEDEEAHVAITEEDVRRAYYAQAGAPPTWWITELQMAPTQLVIADEADGAIYRVPFTIAGSAVEFGDPEGVASYEDVAAVRGTGPVMVYASFEESRSVMDEPFAELDELADQAAVDAAADAGGAAGADDGSGSGSGEDQGDEGGGSADGDGLDASWDGSLDGLPDLSGVTIADLEAALAAESGAARASAADWDADALEAEYDQAGAEIEAAAKLGTGSRFKALVGKLAAKGAKAPRALAAWIGRKKFGKARFGKLAARARKKAAAAPGGEPGTQTGAPGSVVIAADGSHGDFNGEHYHRHTAYGDQGGDETHEHMHRHSGDSVHEHAHAPTATAPAAASTQGGHSDMEFTSAEMAAIRRRLGKGDRDPVSTAEIVAAMDVPLAPTISAAAGEPGDGPVQVPEIGDGTYLIDCEILRDYQQRAIAGDRAVRRMHIGERDTILASAVRDGKFAQARLEHFRNLWDRDPDGARKLVASLAPNLVPMVPMGSNGDFVTDPDMPGDFEAQQAYRTLYGNEDERGPARAGGR